MPDEPASQTPQPASKASHPLCCHWCGYQLAGLPESGVCPECGTAYSPATARTFQPWPNAFEICLRIGWPILLWIALALLVVLTAPGGDGDGTVIVSFCAGWVFAIVAIVNGYFQVRMLLRRSMPDRTRTKGPVAVFRAIGTVACVIIGLVLLLPPLACAACIVVFLAA